MATYTASSAALLTLDIPLDTWEGNAGRKAAKNRLSLTLSSAELAEHIGKIVPKPQANGRLLNIDFRFPESFEALREKLATIGTLTPVEEKDFKERLQRDGAFKQEMTKAASNVLLPQQALEHFASFQRMWGSSTASASRQQARADVMLDILAGGQKVSMAAQKRLHEGELDTACKRLKTDAEEDE